MHTSLGTLVHTPTAAAWLFAFPLRSVPGVPPRRSGAGPERGVNGPSRRPASYLNALSFPMLKRAGYLSGRAVVEQRGLQGTVDSKAKVLAEGRTCGVNTTPRTSAIKGGRIQGGRIQRGRIQGRRIQGRRIQGAGPRPGEAPARSVVSPLPPDTFVPQLRTAGLPPSQRILGSLLCPTPRRETANVPFGVALAMGTIRGNSRGQQHSARDGTQNCSPLPSNTLQRHQAAVSRPGQAHGSLYSDWAEPESRLPARV